MPNCKTCNKLLHKDADFCPSCRDPNPFTQDTDFKSIFILVAGLAVLGLLIYLLFYIPATLWNLLTSNVQAVDSFVIMFWKAIGGMIVIASPILFVRFLSSKNPHIPKSAKYFVGIFVAALALIIFTG